MLSWLANFLSGGVLDKVLGFLSAREQAKLEAMNSDQLRRHEASESTKLAAKEIRLATAGFWEMRLLAAAIAFPFVIHLWSVWLDTQFKFGWAIDKFPAPFDEWEGAILLSFFGLVGISTGMRAIAGAIATGRK